MFLRDLRGFLSNFRPDGTVTIAIPTADGVHELRPINVIEPHPDGTQIEIKCDPWDGPPDVAGRIGRQMQVQELNDALGEHSGDAGVRIAIPLRQHEAYAERMLDIAEVGFTAGSGGGSGIKIITENWDLSVSHVVRFKPSEDLTTSLDKG